MIVVRTATSADIEGIIDLLADAGDRLNGMSTLRPDRALITTRVEKAEFSFGSDAPNKEDAAYFFVVEDTSTNSIVGTTAIYAAVGLKEAFYSYKLGTRVMASRELGIHNKIPTLFLTNDYTGMSEIGSLFVDANYLGTSAGKLASLSRMLFMAEHPHRFAAKVFAEMRGFQDEKGSSPFWEGIGQIFFSMSFSQADDLSAQGNKIFISELMPGHPIYVPLLAEGARDAIGRVHSSTEPARNMLEREGFRYDGYIDIFDGGPTIECHATDLRSVRESEVVHAFDGVPPTNQSPIIVSNREVGDYRATMTSTWKRHESGLLLTPETMRALRVHHGDEVRFYYASPPA